MTISELKIKNAEAGYFFFSKDTMKFFDSKIESPIYGDKYFITSEKSGFESKERCYTIRQIHEDGQVSTMFSFLEFTTKKAAIQQIKKMLEK